jgi:hypothetical protein
VVEVRVERRPGTASAALHVEQHQETQVRIKAIRKHTKSNPESREIYREYVTSYTQALQEPSNTELRIDLQKLEDQLQLVDLVIAREHAKIEVSLRISKVVIT